jgi:hypothetical protein
MARRSPEKARLDADGTAKPKSRLIARVAKVEHDVTRSEVVPSANEYVGEDGERIALSGDPRVEEVVFNDARELETIEPWDQAWKATDWLFGREKYIRGIVRLRPPIDAPDEKVQDLVHQARERGAEKVIVLPRPKAEVLPAKALGKKTLVEDARASVLALVADSNATNKDGLRELVEAVMAEEGI